jgi:hypothetical protein
LEAKIGQEQRGIHGRFKKRRLKIGGTNQLWAFVRLVPARQPAGKPQPSGSSGKAEKTTGFKFLLSGHYELNAVVFTWAGTFLCPERMRCLGNNL